MRNPICSRCNRLMTGWPGSSDDIRGNDPTKYTLDDYGDGVRTQVRSDCYFFFFLAQHVQNRTAGFYERLYTLLHRKYARRYDIYEYIICIYRDNTSPEMFYVPTRA